MRKIASLAASLTLSCVVGGSIATAQGQPSAEVLPSRQQERYLDQIGRSLEMAEGAAALSVLVREGDETVERPYQAASELLILLDPKLRPEQIVAALREHRLRLVSTTPQIGAITVNVSDRLSADAASSIPVGDLAKLSLQKIARELAEDSRFVAVTPNAALSPFQIQVAQEQAQAQAPFGGAATAEPTTDIERTDWGIADAKFDRLWQDMSAPFLVGVIDAGFADHEDLDTGPGLSHFIPQNDHGNHVAGILCAKHNGLGVRGALKNCRVTIAAAAPLPQSAVPEQPTGEIIALLGTFVDSTLEFIDANPNARVINLSLGYNWISNYQFDPRDPGQAAVRDDVRFQGQWFRSVLAYAKRRNVAIVAAAGNDSESLASPLPAWLASPFNMGSRMIDETDGWTNGLVVQAHDAGSRRAGFSNVEGHVSCPGVNVLSALASSRKAYGVNSGTSMAAPYCAAGLATIVALRPELTLEQAIECLLSGPERVDGVPKLDVEFAVRRCRR